MNEPKIGGGGWNRTNGVSYVTDLQSAAFAAQHTPPKHTLRYAFRHRQGVNENVCIKTY